MDRTKNILNAIRGKSPLQTKRNGNWTNSDEIDGLANLSGTNENLVAHYGEVFDDVSLISAFCATIIPRVIRTDEELQDGQEPTYLEPEDHWLALLLSEPNQDTSGFEFRRSIFSYKLLTNNTFIRLLTDGDQRKNDPGGLPTAFDVMNPLMVLPEVVKGQLKYRVNTENGKQKILDSSYVVNIKNFNPSSNVEGYSPLRSILSFVTLEEIISFFQLSLFKNNGVPSGVVIVREKDPENFKSIQENFKKMFSGAKNFGKVGFIRQDPAVDGDSIKFQMIETKNRDLQTDALFDRIEKKKSMAYRVPEEMKGFVKNTSFASASVAERAFFKSTVFPEVTQVWEAFNHWFKRNFPNENIKIVFDDPVPQNEEERKMKAESDKIIADTAQVMISTGFDTNDVINHLKLPADMKWAAPIKLAPVATTEKKVKLPTEDKHVPSYEKRFETAIYNSMQTELKYAIARLNKAKKIEDISSTNEKKFIDDLTKELLPVVEELVKESGEAARLTFVETAAGLSTTTPSLAGQTYIIPQAVKIFSEDYFKRVFKNFVKETQADMNKIMQTALAEQESIGQVERNLRSYYTDGDTESKAKMRARRVARTEVTRFNNYAALEEAKTIAAETGLVGVKVWRTQGDDKVDPICAEMEGRALDLGKSFWPKGGVLDIGDSKFTNSWVSADVPNGHPNCRCYADFEFRKV